MLSLENKTPEYKRVMFAGKEFLIAPNGEIKEQKDLK